MSHESPSVATPLILSAADVAQQGIDAAETDCFTPPETDCACPSERPLFSSDIVVDEAVAYSMPALHTDALPGGSILAFNPLGNTGVVALDNAAWALLNRFRQPRLLADAAGEDDALYRAARRLAELELLQRADRPVRTPRTASQTLTAWLHVTNECNLRCDYCYISKTPDAMDIARGRRAVDAVVRSALAHGFRRIKLKYAGGEATLNAPLVVLTHKYARECADGHRLALDGVVLSNGVALGSRLIRALRDSGLRLMISLDGVGDAHDATRRFVNGRGSFSHVARTLDRLAEHGVIPSISITVSHRNLAGLPATVEYVLDRGLPFSLNFYRENQCSANAADLSFQDDQIIAAMREAFGVIARRLPRHSLLSALVDLARLDTPHDRPCGAGHSYMVIDHRGGVATCHMAIERTVADVAVPDPLLLIHEDAIGIRNVPVDEKEGCRTCLWRYWCAGGCPALTHRITGRYDVKSPNCRIYQTLFPEALRLEGMRLLRYGRMA
ncbi:radical SAM/SPASM domain-containing protein [Roseiflexus castenholzii]|uniref:Radical SAM domain protein n=1 Tax=Roseiflexus castenholzii (strain DSM 13941 / HLO8) TaxID=383372 RepID=A7NH60_ROSCS|nr:radical SAM protein [Roseiflexus castenholzii]ABU56807.1 Radical SAM domain protein [Roseiflexus castenholzii DSM 13941]